MPQLKRGLIFAVSVLFAAVLFSVAAEAQVPRDTYRFLEVEVIDSSGKPVKDAAFDFSGKPVADASDEATRYREGKLKTNAGGRLETRLSSELRSTNEKIGFTIFKPGYFPFDDYFGIIKGNWSDPMKIELLIVPKNAAERKSVGRDQEKRELFGAAKTGDAAMIRKLLRAGLDPNLTTSDLRGVPAERDVPLIVYAASSGSGAAVGELLRAGANVRKKDEPTRNVLAVYLNVDLYYTIYYNHPVKAERAILLHAFCSGAEDLIRAGANIGGLNAGRNYLNSQKETLLMTVAAKGCARAARLLIQKGIPVNATDEYGATALMYAVRGFQDFESRLAVMNLLLASGADINAVTKEYFCRTALMLAVESRDLKTVDFLIKNKAALDPPCESGETALKIAKSMLGGAYANEAREIIKLFEAAGAK